MIARTSVYVIERAWEWEGSDVVAVCATLKGAKRALIEHNGTPTTITRSARDRSVWLADSPRDCDILSITRMEVLP